MARIYFHSPSHTAEIRGSERHYAETVCNDALWAGLGDLETATDLFRPHIPSYFRRSSAEDIRTYLHAPDFFKLEVDGEPLSL